MDENTRIALSAAKAIEYQMQAGQTSGAVSIRSDNAHYELEVFTPRDPETGRHGMEVYTLPDDKQVAMATYRSHAERADVVYLTLMRWEYCCGTRVCGGEVTR